MKIPPITIVLVNNRGGGIFNFLPVAKYNALISPYFQTPHDVSIRGCCGDFGIPYKLVTNESEFAQAYTESQQNDQDCVIEAFTSSIENNVKLHKIVQSAVETQIGQELTKSPVA